MTISVCIPTYNRLKALREAVDSCIHQSLLPNEIIISDDSTSNDTENWIKEIQNTFPVKIRYSHNRPSLKQAANVNQLFKSAESELLVLLHDDDLLMPEALQILHSCFLSNPEIDASFGKQYLISDSGEIDLEGSINLNRDYYRSTPYEGTKLTSLEAGFLQQFPNDGFMIRTNLAREILYDEDAGDACDFDFALRVGMSNKKLYFVDYYTAKYRLSEVAINKTSNNNARIISFTKLEALDVPEHSMPLKIKWLKDASPIALGNAISLGMKKRAFEIYFSKWHREKIFTPGGMLRFLRMTKSFFRKTKK